MIARRNKNDKLFFLYRQLVPLVAAGQDLQPLAGIAIVNAMDESVPLLPSPGRRSPFRDHRNPRVLLKPGVKMGKMLFTKAFTQKLLLKKAQSYDVEIYLLSYLWYRN